jgi:hypothetical protein
MNFEFVPSLCKGENPQFKGSITLSKPSFDEKYQYLEEMGYDEDNKPNTMKMLRMMVRHSEKHYVKIDLQKGDKKITKFEQLSYDDDCHPILIEVAGRLFKYRSRKKRLKAALKQQVRAAYRTGACVNFTHAYVREYLDRKALAEIGYTSDLNDLDNDKADVFLLIHNELIKIQNEESKKRSRHGAK